MQINFLKFIYLLGLLVGGVTFIPILYKEFWVESVYCPAKLKASTSFVWIIVPRLNTSVGKFGSHNPTRLFNFKRSKPPSWNFPLCPFVPSYTVWNPSLPPSRRAIALKSLIKSPANAIIIISALYKNPSINLFEVSLILDSLPILLSW